MNNLATYPWQTVYVSAVLETNPSLLANRVYEALSAIEQRLLSPIESGSQEDKAVKNAQTGLVVLRAECCKLLV
jgi:hypothetical protein